MNKSPSILDGLAEVFRQTYATPMKDGNHVAVFIGMQEGHGDIPEFPLFNMTKRVGEVPEHATVSEQTLRRLGYSCPNVPDFNDARSFDDVGEPLCSL
jgi:hypothetical protein